MLLILFACGASFESQLEWESFLAVPLVLFMLGQDARSEKPAAFSLLLSLCWVAMALSVLSGVLIMIVIVWLLLFYIWVLYEGEALRVDRKKMLLLSSLAWSWPVWIYPELSVYARLIGAHATEAFYQMLGFDVVKHGTQVLVSSVNIDIAESCSGLDTLQTLMLIGTVLIVYRMGRRKIFWAFFCLLPIFALLSHLCRIIVNSGIALGFGADVAGGMLHDVVGLLCTMGFFCLLWFMINYVKKTGGGHV